MGNKFLVSIFFFTEHLIFSNRLLMLRGRWL